MDLSAHIRALRAAQDWNGQTIRLGGHTWDIFPEESAETVICPSNNDCGPARTPFLLEGLRDVTIDGEGARLLVRGTPQAGRGGIGVLYPPVVPFILRDCHNIALKNLRVDWATPGTIQGTCIAIPAPGTLEVQLETDQRAWCWNGQMFVEGEGWTWPVRRLLGVEPGTGAILHGGADNFGAGYDVNWHYEMPRDGVVRITGPSAARPAVGCKVLFWCSNHDVGARRAPAIFIENSSAVTLDTVTLHYAWAMGVIAQNSTDLVFHRLVVEPSGTRGFSLAADGAHFVNCRGSLTFTDCRFQNQFDDAINAHGLYHQVVRQLDAHTLRVRCAHPQHQSVDTFRPGDTLRLAQAPWLAELVQLPLARVTRLNGEMQDLVFAAPLPAKLQPGDWIENLTANAALTIRGCVFRWNRARGILINGPRPLLVEHSTFETSGAAILIDCSTSWAESGPAAEVTLRHNVFQNCTHSHAWGEAVIHATADFRRNAPADLPPLHGKITLAGNQFIACHAPATIIENFAEIVRQESGAPDPHPAR